MRARFCYEATHPQEPGDEAKKLERFLMQINAGH
jgi:hypothetical protein